ncbi:MAG: hypothetical protein R3E48_21840 [Burkholderiaceae bacterium]
MTETETKKPNWRSRAYLVIAPAYLLLIYGLPSVACLGLHSSLAGLGSAWTYLSVFLLPGIWITSFLVIAGTLSLAHQHAVRAGRFPRDLGSSLYFHRRLYGLCWTSVYYNSPAYMVCLAVPPLKRVTFRLFGYRGDMDFTVYPDTWIRDLPLLRFERGVYVSNKATIGTNIVSSSGDLLVGEVTLKAGALVGHLAMLAPGVTLAEGAEVGVGVAVGINSSLGPRAFVGPAATIEHGVQLGKATRIGACCYVASGTSVPDGARINSGSVLRRQRGMKAESFREITLVQRNEHGGPLSPAHRYTEPRDIDRGFGESESTTAKYSNSGSQP